MVVKLFHLQHIKVPQGVGMSVSSGDNGGGGGESGEGRRSEVTLNGMPTVHAD